MVIVDAILDSDLDSDFIMKKPYEKGGGGSRGSENLKSNSELVKKNEIQSKIYQPTKG